MKTITIRGVDSALAEAIKKTAEKHQESMNQTLLKLLKDSLGLTKKPAFPKYKDLDSMAGTWTVKEEKEFIKNTGSFREIDEEMWD
ncbi:antitoxin [bacterium]|nr:antitoxin [bacterium]